MPILGSKIFVGLFSLETLVLMYNSISVTEDETFVALGNLKSLFLNSNELWELRFSMFSGLLNLEHLFVVENKISLIDDNVFSQMKNLRELQLSGNRISTLNREMFSGLFLLKTLGLDRNELSAIDENMFTDLSRPLNLTLSGNPLKCDPELCWLKEKETSGNITWVSDKVKIRSPECSDGVVWANMRCVTYVSSGEISIKN